MCKILRHSAEDEGLKLQPGGYVNVKDLLQTNTMKSLHVTFAELRTIVTSNDKQRFSLIPITEGPSSADPPASNATPTNDTTPPSGPSSFPDDPSAYLIRANQGHSITTVDSASLLAPLSPASAPALCVHGTTAAAWPRILASGGLRPMGRNHVHLATGLPAGFTPLDDGATTNSEGEKEKKGEEVVQAPVISGMRNSSRILGDGCGGAVLAVGKRGGVD
ncbi:tRNA 2'-phosphotransferase [Botryosphaeria dothidea]